MEVGDLVSRIRAAAPFLSGITASGGEATQQAAFLYSLFSAVKADPQLTPLTCFVDSNGSAEPVLWKLLAPVIEGEMIDLKCLDPLIHRSITRQPNGPVLASIRQSAAMGLLYEVRLSLLAGVNDDRDLRRRTAVWAGQC